MSARLEHVIDFEQAEDLIDQHDRYEISECDLQREWRDEPNKYDPKAKRKSWIVYYEGKAIECYDNPPKKPRSYMDLADAIEAAWEFTRRREDGEIATLNTAAE